MRATRISILSWIAALLLGVWFYPAWPSASTFNGSNSQVQVSYVAAIDATTFSAGCWARRTDDDAAVQMVLNHRDTGGWMWWHNGTSDVHELWIEMAGGARAQYTTAQPALNTWVHLAFAYDGTSADPVIYYDAASQSITNTGDTPDTYVPDSGVGLGIGVRPAGTHPWNGQLAECFYYNRVLNANEIKTVMRCGPKSLANGLVGYWPLGVFSGLNLTTTSGIAGTPSNLSVSTIGPPISYPQGVSCGRD